MTGQKRRGIHTTIQHTGAPAIAPGSLPRNRCLFTVLAGPDPGRIFALDGQDLVFGRGDDVNAQLLDEGLSRRHARVFRRDGATLIEDLGSTNGTWLGTTRLDAQHPLTDGDRIALGKNVVVKFSLYDALEEEAARTLYEASVRDQLTRVYNRRHFDERLASEFAYAARHGALLSIVMLDVDHFKRINDTLGHPAGDLVLRQVASAVQRSLRAEDVFARYGGEEFVSLLRGIGREQSLLAAERIRALIEALKIDWEGQRVAVTASLGVATLGPDHPRASPAELVAAADAALYAAKEGGRNRVVGR